MTLLRGGGGIDHHAVQDTYPNAAGPASPPQLSGEGRVVSTDSSAWKKVQLVPQPRPRHLSRHIRVEISCCHRKTFSFKLEGK